MPHINDVVALAQQAVQVSCDVGAGFVFVRHREVRRRLPVEKTEFPQFGMAQSVQAALRALSELVEAFPVLTALLNPGN
jgi:hypothetical protein